MESGEALRQAMEIDELERQLASAVSNLAAVVSTASVSSIEFYDALTELSSLNGRRIQSRLIWQSIVELLKNRTDDAAFIEAIIIGFLEPATELPIYFHDLEEMARMLADPELASVVFAAFDREDFPQNLEAAFDVLTVFRSMNGESSVQISRRDLDLYMEREHDQSVEE